MFVECETQGNILKVKYLGIRILQFTSNLSFYQRSQASGSLQQYSWDPSIRSACTILANLIIAISPVLSNIFRCGKKHLAHITRLQYDQHLITYFSKQLFIFRKPLLDEYPGCQDPKLMPQGLTGSSRCSVHCTEHLLSARPCQVTWTCHVTDILYCG